MKKIISKILAFLGALVLVFSLAGCNKANAIKKAYEKAEYTVEVIDENNSIVKSFLNTLDEEDRESAAEYEFIFAGKGLLNANSAIIIKFPSAKDLKEALNTEKNPSGYNEAKDAGIVNGNCYLVVATTEEAKEIFQKA